MVFCVAYLSLVWYRVFMFVWYGILAFDLVCGMLSRVALCLFNVCFCVAYFCWVCSLLYVVFVCVCAFFLWVSILFCLVLVFDVDSLI